MKKAMLMHMVHDLAKTTVNMENTVMRKLKKGACNLRLRAVALRSRARSGSGGIEKFVEKLC